MWKAYTYLLLVTVVLATLPTHTLAQEAELLAVLRSDAPIQEKSTACRQLARIATKDAVPTLASLLGDEKLSHMARYALEPIPDPSVDAVLREAVGTVQGSPLLGVIGSLGARRDAQAVEVLAPLLTGSNADAAQSAGRALGCIGTAAAAEALKSALGTTSGATQLAVCEGLFRCAESLAAEGQTALAQGIYDQVRELPDAAPQVAGAALRGAILTRGTDGIALMLEAIRGSDYGLAAAAVRSSMEMPGEEVTAALAAEFPKVSTDKQGLLMMALAGRGESQVLPAVLEAAKSEDAQLRALALKALKRVGDASCVPTLLDAAVAGNEEVAKAAMESLEILQGEGIDQQIVKQLATAQGKVRLVLLDLAARRRAAAAAPALWQAADDADPAVRAAAVAGLGAVLDPSDLGKLLARFGSAKDDQEATALDNAVREVCQRAPDREAAAALLAAAIPSAQGPVKARILAALDAVGGATALEAVSKAARSSDQQLRDSAYQVLGEWDSVDAAPVLLDLHKSVNDQRLKTRAIRAYIRLARQFDMPADQRAAMCRTALATATRDDDKRLVLEVLLRYPSDEMLAIAQEAAKVPALSDLAQLVVMGLSSEGIDRAELGRALGQAAHQSVTLEIVKAEYGADDKVKDVTAILRERAKKYRIIFLPSTSYNESFGGDPAPSVPKTLKIQYRINGKDGEATFSENAIVLLPMPK